jgi:glycerophosphoryl diester phosphodiesterase
LARVALLVVLAVAAGGSLPPPAGGEAAEAATSPGPPRVVGHRGLPFHAPEETPADFAACIDLRLDVELDVRRTRDGQLVCLHDDTVDRTTDGTGKVAALSLRELKQLDAGKKFDPAFAGERVPTLEEVFALVRDRKAISLLIAVDIKVPDAEADVVALAKKYGVLNQLMFIGLTIESREVREKLRAASPDARCAVLCPAAEKLDAAATDPTADWVYVRFIPPADEVKKVHGAGKQVFLVGPLVMGKEPVNWAKGRAAHVDAILTDYPLECRSLWRAEKK